jgi:hypothetical protein
MSEDFKAVEESVSKLDLESPSSVIPKVDDEEIKKDTDDNNPDDDASSASLPTSATDEDSDAGVPPEQADDLLIKATNFKEEGNDHFKKGDLEKSAQSYRRGTNTIKKLNRGNTGDEQVKGLLIALQTNLRYVGIYTCVYRKLVYEKMYISFLLLSTQSTHEFVCIANACHYSCYCFCWYNTVWYVSNKRNIDKASTSQHAPSKLTPLTSRPCIDGPSVIDTVPITIRPRST